MRTHSIAFAMIAPVLVAAVIRLSPPGATPSADILRPPSPPDFWLPAATFDIPVKPAQGVPVRVAAGPLNLDSSPYGGNVPQPAADDLWRLAAPATVRVQVILHGHHGQMGTGVIVSPSGLALTALHVVDVDFKSLHVVWNDGQKRGASVVAKDPDHDLALLQIETTGPECFSFLRVAGPDYKDYFNINLGTNAVLMGFGGTPHRLRALPAMFSTSRLFVDLHWADHKKGKEEPIALIYEFEGSAVQGDSGSPVLDERGTVIGIAIGVSVDAARPPIFVTELPHNFHGGLKL